MLAYTQAVAEDYALHIQARLQLSLVGGMPNFPKKNLVKLLKNAVELSNLIGEQVALYQFNLISGGCFSQKEMQDVHGRNAPEKEGHPLLLTIFPSLYKCTDKFGEPVSHET